MLSQEHQQDEDHRDADDVPPHAEIVELRGEPDPEDVDEHLGNHYQHHHEQLEIPIGWRTEDRDCGIGWDVKDPSKGADDVDRRGDVDARGDRDLSDHVEPGGNPRPAPAAQPVGPEVESARRRIRRGQLRHRCGDAEREEAHHRPADRIDDGTRELEAVAKEQNGSGQNRNDGERDREVGESSHFPEQLLGIAEPVEVADILPDLLLPVHRLLGHRAPRVKVGLREDWERAAPPSARYGSGNSWGEENIPHDLGEGKSEGASGGATLVVARLQST